MQKNNNNSFLNKALIFVSAFVVSSLVIYQVYYYNKVKSLSSGIVATAAELPDTQIDPVIPKHFSGNNYMGNAGLLAAVGNTAKSSFDEAPKINYLSGNGVYSKAFLDELNIGISNKFPNHPPIGFNLQEGDKVLFSYLFKNILLPQSFTQSVETLEINGKHFRAITYMYSKKDSATKAIFTGDSLNLLYIPIDKGTQTLIISKHFLAGNTDSVLMKRNIVADTGKAFVIPEIDFNIIKYWKPEEAAFIPNAQQYKQLEERIKLKLSAAQTEPAENTVKASELHPPYYLYLYKNGAAKPYFSLYIANTELLLPAKSK